MILSTFVMLGLSTALAGKGPTVEKEPAITKGAATVGQHQWSGSLAPGDAKLSTGEFFDTYTFEGRKGQTVDIRMTSSALDPYLGLHFGDKNLKENDDAATGEGALVTYTLEEDGTYTIFATSYKPGEKGDYVLVMEGSSARGGAPSRSAASSGPVHGTLESGDSTLESGEYVDKYDYPCAAGTHVSARVTSTDFDTYVAIDIPGEDRKENDDAATGSGALIEADVSASGTCAVFVTSYKAGETGAYTLEVSGFDAPGSSGPPTVASSGDTLGADLEAGLHAWVTAFKGHKGTASPTEIATRDYETDLRMSGAQSVKVIEHLTFGILTQTTLSAQYGSFSDESTAVAAYQALVARVQNASMPCCTFAAVVNESDVLRDTSWLPFDFQGRMGPLESAMIDVSLMKLPKLVGSDFTMVWDLDLTILHTP